MYSYCVTAAPSGSTIGAIKCRLLKNSQTEYLVCLKRHSIDIYSLKSLVNGEDDNLKSGKSDSNIPVLTATLKAYSTLVTFIEYRPPGSCQSHILVLTKNYLLILLTYDEENGKFISKPLVSMQESSCNEIDGQVLLKVDRDYNLILFYGIKRTIKCIILNKNDYFNFYDLVTLRTKENVLLDIEFMNVEYKSYNDEIKACSTRVEESSPSSSHGRTVSAEKTHFNKKDNRFFLECRIIVLGQDSYSLSDEVEPTRWFYGMQLFFEIDDGNECRRFNSYGHVPLFGDPIQLNTPYNMFIPLSLNNSVTHDSTLLLGAGGIGFITYKDPKTIKHFHLNFCISEITSYCTFDDKYVLGDDNGNIYILELLLGKSVLSSGLKRRVPPVTTSIPLPKTIGNKVVDDVIVNKIGCTSIPTSIVQLSPDVIFLASRMGNSCTLRISYSDSNANSSVDFIDTSHSDFYKLWSHTNLGPITDFTFGEENTKGCKSILACCGIGSSGKLCSISLGVGVETLCSSQISGVSNLFSVSLPNCNDDAILCCSFYRHTKFYRIVFNDTTDVNDNTLELCMVNMGRIFRIKLDGLVEDNRTILVSNITRDLLIQVTTKFILVVSCKTFKIIERKEVDDFSSNPVQKDEIKGLESNDSQKNDTFHSSLSIVIAEKFGKFIILLLSNHDIIILDGKNGLSLVNRRNICMNISAIAYISGSDAGFNSSDLIALSTWGKCMILIMTVLELSVVCKIRVLCNFGIFIKSLKFGRISQRIFLFVGLSDGKLLIYNISIYGNEVNLKLDNAIQISNTAMTLVTLNGSNDTCDLSNVNIITTGDYSTVIYCNNEDLQFASINIPKLSKLCTLPISMSSDGGIIVAYYSEHKLVIGKLDTIERLHVQTLAYGRTFDKICFHSPSKLAIVACPPELIMNTNNENENFTAVKRKNVFMCLDYFTGASKNASKLPALAKFINIMNRETIYNLTVPYGHLVSSICTVSFDGYTELIAIGTSKVSDSQDLPTEGFLYLVQVSEYKENRIILKLQKTIEAFDGGVVEMTPFNRYLVVAINHKLMILSNSQDGGKRYNLQSLYYCDDLESTTSTLKVEAEYNSNTFVVSLDCFNDNIVVGDLITSVKLLKYSNNKLIELCRDFNSIWCTAASAIDENTTIISDDSGNFSIFSRNSTPSNDEQRAKFNVIGLFHHGEVVNKIRRLNISNVICEHKYIPISLRSMNNCKRLHCCSDIHEQDDFESIDKPSFIDGKFNKFLICATSSGSIMQICIFDDFKLFLRLSLLEEILIGIQADIGHITNNKWHNFQNSYHNSPSKGFIDGDTIECFLSLSPQVKSKVLEKLKESSKDLDLGLYSIESLTLEIEHLKRLH